MKRIRTLEMFMHDLLRDESGQDLVEYALVAVVIGLGAVAAMRGVAGNVSNVFAAVGTTLTGNA